MHTRIAASPQQDMPLLKGLLLCVLYVFTSLHEAACQAPPPHAHHALRLEVEENTDPRGDPGMEPCASTDGELEELYKTCEAGVGTGSMTCFVVAAFPG